MIDLHPLWHPVIVLGAFGVTSLLLAVQRAHTARDFDTAVLLRGWWWPTVSLPAVRETDDAEATAEATRVSAMAVQQFSVIVEWDAEDDVWVTHVPTLGHLSTYGETRQVALDHTREAILGYLEAAGKAGIPVPRTGGPVSLP